MPQDRPIDPTALSEEDHLLGELICAEREAEERLVHARAAAERRIAQAREEAHSIVQQAREQWVSRGAQAREEARRKVEERSRGLIEELDGLTRRLRNLDAEWMGSTARRIVRDLLSSHEEGVSPRIWR